MIARMQKDDLDRFGFRNERGGAHLARTMMLEELQRLLSYVNDPKAEKSPYFQAIEAENCLAKRSGRTRSNLTARHLSDLYALDPALTLFRSGERDLEGQPLLALICAYARDSILCSSATFIQSYLYGEKVTREALEELSTIKSPNDSARLL